ncbi:hypothetical protein BDV25DRAFT_157791 [Aspergillus avenaceus]|uniref:SnoaL-like domain-containing protein n=1 Tax=Aspergillus avenaceus TaxID=36643 RepID=A0A5N6TQR3_ASPAV|nr:hypothetical protein BDV25DRAFT_157791 [Aspergillus avenaceus]
MSFQASLPALSEREAIVDAINRALLSFDAPDLSLFKSSFTEDAVLDLDGRVMNGIDALRAECWDRISKLDTTHTVSNLRVSHVPGESAAHVLATVMAQHYREGQGKQEGTSYLLAGCLYFVDVVKDESDGLWKVKHWRVKFNWIEGDWGVVRGE